MPSAPHNTIDELKLLTPLRVGPYDLRNRAFMAPLTRCRARPDGVPTPIMATYYAQRAGAGGAGLIISEATQISQQGQGYPNTPGIYTPEHAQGWRTITRAVHDRGGRIFCQLWHVGRSSHNAYQPGGALPVSSSAIGSDGDVRLPDGSSAPRPTPRALEAHEIPLIIDDYRRAAATALDAGFDGVELHGANGYLPDQFLRDGVNHRTDDWGGTIDNRARFMLEACRALVGVWGADRVGVRLSPSGVFGTMRDSDPWATYGHVIAKLGAMNLAYLHIMEAMEEDLTSGPTSVPTYRAIPVREFRPLFKGVLVTNAGFTRERAEAYIREGWADAIAFGKLFIANPDLAERFRLNAPLNPPDPSTFYASGEKGYTDYPALA